MAGVKSKLETAPEEIRKDIILWNSEGSYSTDIQKKIKDKYNFEISVVPLRKFITRHTGIAGDILVGSTAFQEKVAREFSSIIFKLKTTSDILATRLNKLERDDGATSELCMVAERIEKECELASKIITTTPQKNNSETVKDTIMRVTEKLNSEEDPSDKNTLVIKREIEQKTKQ